VILKSVNGCVHFLEKERLKARKKGASAPLYQALRASTYVYTPARQQEPGISATSASFPPCLQPLQPVCRLISADKPG